MRPAQSGRASSMAWYQISVCERVLVNTRVLRASAMVWMTCGNNLSPRCPAHGKRSMCSGTTLSMAISLGISPCILRPAAARAPSNTCMALSVLPKVAERPQICVCGRQPCKRAMASCVKTPRLLPISSCHSSTIMAARELNLCLAPGYESRSERLSGVVMSTVGSCFCWRARTEAGVSPVRVSTVQSSSKYAMGSRSAWLISAAKARSGVSHKTFNGIILSAAPSE